jgi:hypothetical protein
MELFLGYEVYYDDLARWVIFEAAIDLLLVPEVDIDEIRFVPEVDIDEIRLDWDYSEEHS